jgi:hypothetical protein
LLETHQLRVHPNQEPGHLPAKAQLEVITTLILGSVELTVTKTWDLQLNKNHKSSLICRMSQLELRVLLIRPNNNKRLLKNKNKEKKMREEKGS